MMIGLLRRIYSKQNLIRGVAVDRLLQLAYARWLSIRKKGRLFTVFTEISSKCNLACENCYRTNNDYPSKNLNMDFNTFKKIIFIENLSNICYINLTIITKYLTTKHN
ncbi:MAG: hypothetical protein HF978_06190 [Desulfobacteraceae bacterium]|nr:hypothetical protein [Desulfobacteraceae bacterium]MBC2755124.1 hypothetical protein [Desulfobacteraceae bacterium]